MVGGGLKELVKYGYNIYLDEKFLNITDFYLFIKELFYESKQIDKTFSCSLISLFYDEYIKYNQYSIFFNYVENILSQENIYFKFDNNNKLNLICKKCDLKIKNKNYKCVFCNEKKIKDNKIFLFDMQNIEI